MYLRMPEHPANRTIIESRAIYAPEKQCTEYFGGGRIQRNNGPGGEDVWLGRGVSFL